MDNRGQLNRGSRVLANTADGVVERRVWDDLGDAVLICSETQFAALTRGAVDAPMPIGFPKRDLELVNEDQ